MASPTSRPPSKPVQALDLNAFFWSADCLYVNLIIISSCFICQASYVIKKNKSKNHLKRDVHEIISYTSLFTANQYNTVNILLTLHPSMLRNLPHRYELSQLSAHCKQRSFHLRHDQCKVFSSQYQSLSLLKCFRR